MKFSKVSHLCGVSHKTTRVHLFEVQVCVYVGWYMYVYIWDAQWIQKSVELDLSLLIFSICCVVQLVNTLQHTASHCNTLRHTATHRSTLQHTAILLSIRRALWCSENKQVHTHTHMYTHSQTCLLHANIHTHIHTCTFVPKPIGLFYMHFI